MVSTVSAYIGYVDVDVELDDFDTDELIEELERRGADIPASNDVIYLIHSLYEKRRMGIDYTRELDDIIYQAIGRIS